MVGTQQGVLTSELQRMRDCLKLFQVFYFISCANIFGEIFKEYKLQNHEKGVFWLGNVTAKITFALQRTRF